MIEDKRREALTDKFYRDSETHESYWIREFRGENYGAYDLTNKREVKISLERLKGLEEISMSQLSIAEEAARFNLVLEHLRRKKPSPKIESAIRDLREERKLTREKLLRRPTV